MKKTPRLISKQISTGFLPEVTQALAQAQHFDQHLSLFDILGGHEDLAT
jgi:hypothetical protein